MTDGPSNTNDARKDARLEFIKTTLRHEIGLEPLAIRPVAYEDDFPFPYNNFVYHIKFEPGSIGTGNAPGTSVIPADASECVLRLPNALSSYNNEIRVQNEVAALAIAREAIEASFPNLVPRVFAWGSASSGQGWIVQQYMPGSPLLEDFGQMSPELRKPILEQMAGILAALQTCKLPASVQGFGGLQFGPAGECISGPMSFMEAGPFTTYRDFVRATIDTKLDKADCDPQVNGWRANGVRARLDRFLEEGLPSVMQSLGDWPRALVHADFTVDNLLYDKSTMRITALLDFDFSHVGTFCDEFFRSLGGRIGQFPSARESDDVVALRQAMLSGFSEPLPPDNEDVEWSSAKMWDDALSSAGAKKPSNIVGIDELSDLFWLSGQLLPFKLCNEVVVRNSSSAQLQAWRGQGEERLLQFLSDHGY